MKSHSIQVEFPADGEKSPWVFHSHPIPFDLTKKPAGLAGPPQPGFLGHDALDSYDP